MMAPLTRMRGTKFSDSIWVPGDLHVEYYSQRASKGGFQLTEACPISRYVSLAKLLENRHLTITLSLVDTLGFLGSLLKNRLQAGSA